LHTRLRPARCGLHSRLRSPKLGSPVVDADRTALLVMDLQDGVVQRLGDPGMLERTATAIAAARASGVRVIYVRVAFRPGYPEVSARNRTFSAPQ
jgi:nicotinamidase-related amidase